MRIFRWFHLARAWRKFAQAFLLVRSPRVPMRLKLLAGALALLILSPLNILGDIPLLGIFDDVALMSMLAGWFVSMAGRHDAMLLEGEVVSNR